MNENQDFQNISTGPKYRYSASLAQKIEKKWQTYWTENNTFCVSNPVGNLQNQNGALKANKKFILDMFPYPSGAGLHVGHTLGFIATDVYARYFRMNQTSVLYTMGFDAFGLPAEQYAIETGTHPRKTTQKNINRYLEQISGIGLSHDLNRRVETTDPEFYKWTQWIFLQIFNAWFDDDLNKARPISELIEEFNSGKKTLNDGRSWNELSELEKNNIINDYRLVYQSDSLVNWAPGLGTVLANEEVTDDGKSERGNFPVFRKQLKQWMMRITKYADRLDSDLEDLDWPETIKAMQHNWIGKSKGTYIDFEVTANDGTKKNIKVYTTRVETLYGVSYLALSPENELVDLLVTKKYSSDISEAWKFDSIDPLSAVEKYKKSIAAKSDVERMENKDKTGVFLGVYAKHPLTGKDVPVFISDYVLSGYGTGAVMGVPAHDERDEDFAKKYELPIVEVLSDSGKLVNSDNLNGLEFEKAKHEINSLLEENSRGEVATQYKLRDWLFARQRYWGEPFPIVYDDNNQPLGVNFSDLPVELPNVEDYTPNTFDPDDSNSEPLPPLGKETDWINYEYDFGEGLKTYKRDANVMPQWAGSSWYYLRYIDPKNSEQFVAPENENFWIGSNEVKKTGGVDLYMGGVEHAVLHLLYARFWHKVLHDLGYVSSSEPFYKLFNQGYVQGYAYTDNRGVYVEAKDVIEENGKYFYKGNEVKREYGKLGKSLKNSVTPDEMIEQFGADTLRVYEMYMGPLEISRPWSTKDVIGSQRFLQRVWRLIVDEETGNLRLTNEDVSHETTKLLNATIRDVKENIEDLKFNTAIAKLIELTNHFTKNYPFGITQDLAEKLILMLAPFAPHMAEEIWSKVQKNETTLAYSDFPKFDSKVLEENKVDLPVQVQGKFVTKISIPKDIKQDEAVKIALDDEKIKAAINSNVKRIIFVPGRMMNILI